MLIPLHMVRTGVTGVDPSANHETFMKLCKRTMIFRVFPVVPYYVWISHLNFPRSTWHQVLPQGAFQSQLAAQVQGWSRHHDQLAKASDKLGQRVRKYNVLYNGKYMLDRIRMTKASIQIMFFVLQAINESTNTLHLFSPIKNGHRHEACPISAKTMYNTYSLDHWKKYAWFPVSNNSNVHSHGWRIPIFMIRSQE